LFASGVNKKNDYKESRLRLTERPLEVHAVGPKSLGTMGFKGGGVKQEAAY